jgi:hypothetical protein
MSLECKHVWNYISEYLDESWSLEAKDFMQRHLEGRHLSSTILDSTRNTVLLTESDCYLNSRWVPTIISALGWQMR